MSIVVASRRMLLSGTRLFRFLRRRGNPRVVDAAVALVVFVAMAVVGTGYHPPGWRGFDLWAYVLTAVICLPLAASRIAPMPTLAVVCAGYAGYLSVGYVPSLNVYAPMIAFYTMAATRPLRVAAVGAALLAATLFYSGLQDENLPTVVAVAQSVAFPPVIWVLAGVSRRLSLRNRQLLEATEQLRREQERRVEHAVVQERLQIARELHDVVAHHISVISMQAGLARYVFDSDPPTALAAVRTIASTSRETLEELRRVLTLLRTSEIPLEPGAEPVETEPAPGFQRLAALIDRVRGVGVRTSLEIIGAVDELPSGLQLMVYRVIQEALTNVIKHAGPCRAEVVVRLDRGQLTVTITDDGDAVVAVDHSGGHGLVGMRERARLYHGTLTAGPRTDGGYAVRLAVPWPLSPTHRRPPEACESDRGGDAADDQRAGG